MKQENSQRENDKEKQSFSNVQSVEQLRKEMKKKIESLKSVFGDTHIKYVWNSSQHKEDYPEWYLYEFGKFCYEKSRQEERRRMLKDELIFLESLPQANEDDCVLDHHGYCQQHNLELDCNVLRVKNRIKKIKEELKSSLKTKERVK